MTDQVDLTQGDDGLPLGPEDKRRTTRDQPKIYLDGNEAAGFMASFTGMQRDTRQILTTLRTVVAPQLADLKLAVRAGDERMERHATVAHNRIDDVSHRVGNLESRKQPRTIFVFIALVIAFALGGTIARVAGARALAVLGPSTEQHHAD